MRAIVVAIVAAWLQLAAVARTQSPAQRVPVAVPVAVQNPSPASPNATAPPPVQGEPYVYQQDGRRDPFVSLLGSGVEPRAASVRGEGPAGMTVGEITVRGVVQSNGAMVAMIQGPDKKTYVVHQGDKLLDGTIKAINQQGLIISQDVNDPLSIVKQREVRKLLRSLEGGKE